MTQSKEYPKFCVNCGAELQTGARFCSKCAQPIGSPSNFQGSAIQLSSPTAPERKVGCLLGVGILVMPYIFSWVTLGKGYPTITRLLSFSWMVFLLGVAASPDKGSDHTLAPSSQTSPVVTRYEATPKAVVINSMKLSSSWTKSGFGNVMLVDFEIENPTDYQIKDIEVTCTNYANSGTKIDSNRRTIYELIPAKERKVIKDFNMGLINSQTSRSGCEIDDLVVVQ
ncbi:MAG: zinc ribbon domain-containing protein [Methylotetracoccus sp.]